MYSLSDFDFDLPAERIAQTPLPNRSASRLLHLDGTIIEERIGHAAGADTPKGLTLTELRQAIEAAGMVPVERTPDFRPVSR